MDADLTVVAFQGIVNATHIDEQLKFLTKVSDFVGFDWTELTTPLRVSAMPGLGGATGAGI